MDRQVKFILKENKEHPFLVFPLEGHLYRMTWSEIFISHSYLGTAPSLCEMQDNLYSREGDKGCSHMAENVYLEKILSEPVSHDTGYLGVILLHISKINQKKPNLLNKWKHTHTSTPPSQNKGSGSTTVLPSYPSACQHFQVLFRLQATSRGGDTT